MFNETCLCLPSTLSDVLITISLRLTGNLVDARTFELGNFGFRSLKLVFDFLIAATFYHTNHISCENFTETLRQIWMKRE
jgi:hypothetical protein